MSPHRPPKLTVLCRSMKRVWFLLHRGQFHLSAPTQASAPLSTGVEAVRRTLGQLFKILGSVQVTINNQSAVLAVEYALFERQRLVYPPATAADTRGREPAVGHKHLAPVQGGF